MTLAEWAQIIQSASLILASVFAICGINAWRREYVGKRRIELAEEVLALFYQARDAVDAIRSPFGFGGEGSSRKPGPDELPAHKEALDQAYVLVERYSNYTELFARLHALRYRFMAQLGSEAAAPFIELNRIVQELILSAHEKARLSTLPESAFRTQNAKEKHYKRLLEVDSVYYGTSSEYDPIAPRVRKAVADIEKTCRPIIESKGTMVT